MSKLPELKAASVHALTALGAVCALFSIHAALARSPEIAFAWLGVAFVIDGVDGFFARRYDVKTVLPHISGETLDLCVDYVTYVFVPVLLLQIGGPLQGASGMALSALILTTALYHFADTSSKADDNCFVGFPAVWNLVAFYVYALVPPLWVTYVMILSCCALSFVRLRWVHPMRVVAHRGLTLCVTLAWFVAAAWVVSHGFPADQWTGLLLAATAFYGIGLSLFFSLRR